MKPELKGLNGGSKQFYLRIHRKEVESFYFEHGPEATMEEYCMSQATLERFWSRKNREVRITRLSDNDRWVYKAAVEMNREIKRRIAKLEQWKEDVDPIIEVGRSLINATVGQMLGKVENNALLEGYPRRDNFGEKSEK